MPSGGARPGAGRKPKAEKYRVAIGKAEKQIVDMMPDLVKNLVDLAHGVTIQETDAKGEKRIYTRPPDYKANEYLLNRIMGRPTENIEADLTSKGEQIGVVGFEVVRPDNADEIDDAGLSGDNPAGEDSP